MKKIVIILLGITLFWACSNNSENNVSPDPIDPNINTNPQYFTVGPDLTDIQGNVYHSVTNCSQTWMKSNLNVSKYRNGDVIPEVLNNDQWRTLTTGAWCWKYSNNPSLGKLYNWYAINDPRGLAPSGWHIPSIDEWYTLSNCMGGINISGGKFKEQGTSHWPAPNTGADNMSGLTALPSSGRNFTGGWDFGDDICLWWSSSNYDATQAFYCYVNYNHVQLCIGGKYMKTCGFSVRCVKN
jgi:uncharacterized protein (TIGR02145 family)